VVAVARRKAERERAVQRAKDAIAEIHATGVQVKDIDIGLLDFPCKVEGENRPALRKLGNPKITHWHSTEEGFAGRKPIDERIERAGRKSGERVVGPQPLVVSPLANPHATFIPPANPRISAKRVPQKSIQREEQPISSGCQWSR